MLTVEFKGADRVVGRIDELQKRLDGLYQNIPEELKAWQEEDMHRKQPFAKSVIHGHSSKATTVIRPRSRKSQKWRAARRAARRAAARAGHFRSSVHRLRRNQPILRPELFTELCGRMAELMHKTITWS